MEDFPEDRGAELREQAADETAYLLHSPKNAEKLRSALGRANSEIGKVETLDEFMISIGFDPSELDKR